MKRKSIITALVATVAIVASSAGYAAGESIGDPGRAWAVPNDAALGQHVQEFLDTFPGEMGSQLVSNSGYERYPEQDPTCSSLADSKCSSGNIRYDAVIPFCKDASDVNCTADLGIIDADGKKTSAVFKRYFPSKAQNEFTGSPANKLPSGTAGSLFSIPQAPHDGGDLYYLSVEMRGGGSSLDRIKLHDFAVKLYPVSLEPLAIAGCAGGRCQDTGWGILKAGTGGNPTGKDVWVYSGPGFSGTNFCVATSATESSCAQRYAFPAGIRFYVSVRSQQLPAGWLHGRLTSPDISISAGSGSSTIEIQGNPVAVPVVYKMYNYAEMPEGLKSQYDVKTGGYKKDPNYLNNPNGYVQGGRSAENEDPLKRNVIYSPEASSAAGMEQLRLWLPFVNDKATALLSYWSARTLSEDEMSGASDCFSDSSKVTGIVTTNSTQYSAGPPKFSKSEGTLNYQVASPHFGTTGDVFKGSYDLVMRSDVARCVYGFSKAPIQATLSITSADGTPQVATTVIGERNGWLYLQAKNFEFSAPTVKVKLTQEGSSSAKTSSITCVKGKFTKKVTAAKPTCPSGYKKKG
jgi:hypothetical protein